jgi:hypothetical protein
MKNLPAGTFAPRRSTSYTSEVPTRRNRIASLSVLSAMAVTLSAGRLVADPLPPTNLPPGATQYEILFETTGTTNATSSNINTYNSFVQSEVTPALAALDPVNDWHAIASTRSVSAATNAPSVAGIPVYTTAGQLITNLGLYSTNLVETEPNITQFGTRSSNDFVWTGSDQFGAQAVPLGSSTLDGLTYGDSYSFGPFWLNVGLANQNSDNSLYALSGPIDVPNSTPEPASLALFGTGLLAVGAVGVVRRRSTLGPRG